MIMPESLRNSEMNIILVENGLIVIFTPADQVKVDPIKRKTFKQVFESVEAFYSWLGMYTTDLATLGQDKAYKAEVKFMDETYSLEQKKSDDDIPF